MADHNIPVPSLEFIDREKPRPPDLRALASDMASVGVKSLEASRAPIGEPPLDYSVRSVYDSRPVNATDFNRYATGLFGDPHTGTVGVVTFPAVPEGYIFVIREFFVWVETTPILSNRSDIQMTPQVNGADDVFTRDVPVGAGNDTPIKCFLIVNEFLTYGVKFTINVALGNSLFNVWAYGNVLVKSGRPPQFEIANPGLTGNLPSAHPTVIAPPAPLPPVSVQQPAFVPSPMVRAPVVPKRRVTFRR